jgi:hypothetical protein
MAYLQPDARGRVNPNDLYRAALARLQGHPLVGTIPRDGARYGIRTGSANEWAHYLTQLAGKESSYNTRTVGDVGYVPGKSNGLFQLSPNDAPNYRLNGGKPFSMDQLRDPNQNLDATLHITKTLLDKHGTMQTGVGKYWGPLSREGWTPKPYSDGMYGQNSGMMAVGNPPQRQAQPNEALPESGITGFGKTTPDEKTNAFSLGFQPAQWKDPSTVQWSDGNAFSFGPQW